MKEFCEYCGRVDYAVGGLQEHHLIRRSAGGLNRGTIWLCGQCHRRATDDKKFEKWLQVMFKDKIKDANAKSV